MERRPIDPRVGIGHVHLKVADLERSLAFYRDVLIGLNTWESRGGTPPPAGTTGLYHVAILYPTRSALADALRRLVAAGIPLTGAADHGVSEALYLDDPDGNGVELYWDRPRDAWPRDPTGGIAMYTRQLDLDHLLAEPDPPRT
jgi:catechol 2,3-dioxygenase